MNRSSGRLSSGQTKAHAYPRYFFTNMSADIRHIFRDHCVLDEFIGPKP